MLVSGCSKSRTLCRYAAKILDISPEVILSAKSCKYCGGEMRSWHLTKVGLVNIFPMKYCQMVNESPEGHEILPLNGIFRSRVGTRLVYLSGRYAACSSIFLLVH